MWILTQDDPIPEIVPKVEVLFRRVRKEDAPAIAGAMGNRRAALERLSDGRRCWAGWVAGQVVAYGWVSFDAEYVGELDLHIRLLPGEAYIWDCATLPAFRRQGIFSALLAHMVRDLRAGGVHQVWIGANLDNEPSQRGIDRAGFRRVADLVVEPGAPAREGWLQAYPGVAADLVAQQHRLLLGNAVLKKPATG